MAAYRPDGPPASLKNPGVARPVRRLFLLDAMALIYRAHFAFIKSPRINSRGESTGATFGFVNTLLEVLQKEAPTHLGVAFDTSAPTFRHTRFADYKANRQAQPEDIALAQPYVRRILKAMRIPILELDGYEADDVIGTLAWQAADAGFEVFMMTPDKDFGQLVRDHVYLYKPSYQGKGVDILGVEEIKERWGIAEPGQVRDILGLMGDASDNIPGVPGIGEKTAAKLIAEYGSVEALLENTGSLKGKLAESLTTYAEQARLSKELACIDTRVPVAFDAEDLELSEPDEAAIASIFEELEFKTLLARLLDRPRGAGTGVAALPNRPRVVVKERSPSEARSRSGMGDQSGGGQLSLFGAAEGGAVPYPGGADDLPFEDDGQSPTLPDPDQSAVAAVAGVRSADLDIHQYHLVDDPAEIDRLVALARQQTEVCFDTETDSLEAPTARLVGVSLCWREREAYFIPVPDDDEEAHAIVARLRPLMEDETVIKVGQNLKYDIIVLRRYGVTVRGRLYDTMLAHYLLEPELRHNMDVLAQTYLDYTPIPITDLIGPKGKGQLTMREVPMEALVEYACEDADITLRLKHALEPLIAQADLDELLSEVEVPLVPVLAAMEGEGVTINLDALAELSTELSGQIIDAEARIHADAGEPFNVSSPMQLGKILFVKLKLDAKARKTPSGQYATGEEVLNRLAAQGHAIAKHVLEYRQLLKLKNTYIDALPGLINPVTGRVHTNYNQAVASTGRLSSTNPNLQNIPIRTDLGKEIRRAFIPRSPGHVLVSADYSQIELRIMASFSEDETMMEAFRQGRDIHAITAARIYKVDVSEVTGDMRRKAKTANFGIIYGISSVGLAARLDIPRTEAATLIREYFKEFPAIKAYMDRTIAFARDHEYVTTMLGRRRYVRDINSRNATQQGMAERNAINAPIQGTAADMIKIAMIRIQRFLEQEKLETRMILQVHDELVFDAPEEEVERLRGPVTEHMEQALLLKVPIEVGFGVGKNWLDAH